MISQIIRNAIAALNGSGAVAAGMSLFVMGNHPGLSLSLYHFMPVSLR